MLMVNQWNGIRKKITLNRRLYGYNLWRIKKNSETQSKQEPVTFESLQPQEIKEEPKIQPITFESIKKKKKKIEIRCRWNIYRTAVGALRDVAQGTIDFSEWIESPFDLITPDKYKGGVVKNWRRWLSSFIWG